MRKKWENTNVDNSIYIVCPKCELSHFEDCRSWRLFAENVHNSIETWLRLRAASSLPPSFTGILYVPSPPLQWRAEQEEKKKKTKVMSVSCPGDSPPFKQEEAAAAAALLFFSPFVWIHATLIKKKKKFCCWWARFAPRTLVFVTLPSCIIGRTLNFNHLSPCWFPWQIFMMDSVVDLNGFLSIKHVTEMQPTTSPFSNNGSFQNDSQQFPVSGLLHAQMLQKYSVYSYYLIQYWGKHCIYY